MTRADFLHFATTRLLPSVGQAGADVKSGTYWRSIALKTGVSIAVDAFEAAPFTMRVHLVTYDDRRKKQWKAWDAAIRAGKGPGGSGPCPGGLVPEYDASAKTKAFFGFEWRHNGSDYDADAALAEQLVRWLRALVA
jgi:hypothetical protein